MPTTIVLYVEYEATARYLRSVGCIVQVEVNGQKRPPKSTKPDNAYRWLAANGYEPVPEEFRFLDRPGCPRRRRRQVYRKVQ